MRALAKAPVDGWPLSPRAESMRQRWSRIEIVDGLEVLIRDDVSPLARRLANQFIEHRVGGSKA